MTTREIQRRRPFPYENVILCCKVVTYKFDYESGALPLSYCGKFEISRIPERVADIAPIHSLA